MDADITTPIQTTKTRLRVPALLLRQNPNGGTITVVLYDGSGNIVETKQIEMSQSGLTSLFSNSAFRTLIKNEIEAVLGPIQNLTW